MNRPPRSPVAHRLRAQQVRLGRGAFQLLIELASDTQMLVPAPCIRVSADEIEKAFGNSEVRLAVVAAPDLRYVYVNPSYRSIRPDVAMLGRTYREVFPEAAEAGAEQRLKSVIATSETWIVDDYPTWLPNRDVPAWWQGECVPIALDGSGTPDAALILIWDVTQRHVPEFGAPAKSEERTRIDAARVKLTVRMSASGLEIADGWHISEEIRETDEATEWILRPLHLQHVAPPSLVERVAFPRFAKG
jgi:hypothetical protein